MPGALEEKRVRAAWDAVVERIALARSRVVDGVGDVLVLESSEDVARDVAVAVAGPWTVAVRSEQCARFNVLTGPLMRLRYLPGSGEESALALVVHHAVADARTALWLLQDVIRDWLTAVCRPRPRPVCLRRCRAPSCRLTAGRRTARRCCGFCANCATSGIAQDRRPR
jgi:hypothetical protein